MNRLNKLISECNEIKDEIISINSDNPNIKPIPDGIVNLNEYTNAKYKILWILKESNDLNENSEGGGWCLNEQLNKLTSWNEKKGAGDITIQRMIYASYGILTNFIKWKDMPSIYVDEVFNSLKKIAYINVKKIPGGSKANYSQIEEAYENYKHILLKQINVYDPDIIITGNTLQYFFNDLNINHKDKKYVDINTRNTTFYTSDKRLYIHAYHPAYFTIKEETYCNEIISAVENWEKSRI